jgi:hypothetical protein
MATWYARTFECECERVCVCTCVVAEERQGSSLFVNPWRCVQSSATFLFVLDELRRKRPTEATAPWVVGMGYGASVHHRNITSTLAPPPLSRSLCVSLVLTAASHTPALVPDWRSRACSCGIPITWPPPRPASERSRFVRSPVGLPH